jgi:hypothetical protein
LCGKARWPDTAALRQKSAAYLHEAGLAAAGSESAICETSSPVGTITQPQELQLRLRRNPATDLALQDGAGWR